jgi:hypothetical protein
MRQASRTTAAGSTSKDAARHGRQRRLQRQHQRL